MKTIRLLLTLGLVAGMTNVTEGMYERPDENKQTPEDAQRQAVNTNVLQGEIAEIASSFTRQLATFKTYVDSFNLEGRETLIDSEEYEECKDRRRKSEDTTYVQFVAAIATIQHRIDAAKALSAINVAQHSALFDSVVEYVNTPCDQATETWKKTDRSMAIYELHLKLIDKATFQSKIDEINSRQ